MSLTGKRAPGNPFLDIGAGGCFACPIVDDTGNFLIAERNANPLYDKTGNTGCTIKVKWEPSPFCEPGLAGMQGVKDVIWEQRLFDGTRITGYLYDLAEAKGLGDATPAAKEWVTARWLEIARSPYNNDTMRSYMFALLKEALNKKVEERTAGEKKLIQSFAGYIQQRRTYLAEQALGMYDSWKVWDDNYRAQTGQSRSLGAMFYYGTVPYNFHETLSGLMGLGAPGGAMIGAMVAANRLRNRRTDIWALDGHVYIRQIRGRSRLLISKDLELLKAVQGVAQGLTAVSGATVIQVAFSILSSIAIEQFVKIEAARPKLEAALANAKQPVDLEALSNSTNGEDTLYLYWSKAMDATDKEDPQVIQLAAMAQVRAEQSGYAAPPKTTISFAGTSNTDRLSSGTSGVS